MSKTKDPWFKFFPSNWRADEGLRTVSLAARGLWIEMLCVMHGAEPRGYLMRNGKPITHAQLAALAGCTVEEVGNVLTELADAGVFEVDRAGKIYSRKMVSDTAKSAIQRSNVAKRWEKEANKRQLQDHEIEDEIGAGNTQRDTDATPKKLEARDQKLEEEGRWAAPPDGEPPGLFGQPDLKVDPVPIAFAEWNALARRLNLSIAEVITDDRRKRLKARLAAGGLEAWRRALAGVEASAWCRGERGDFRANLDFVLVPKNFQKLIEGGYGREHPVVGAQAAGQGPARAKAPFPNAEVRAKIVEASSEVFAATWLDGCKWRPAPRPAIVAPSQTVADRIKRECWAVITGLGLEIIAERPRP